MTTTLKRLQAGDRAEWEPLYHGQARFYKTVMTEQILDTVWGWIHDHDYPFYGLIARDADAKAVGLAHCRQMPSPLRWSDFSTTCWSIPMRVSVASSKRFTMP